MPVIGYSTHIVVSCDLPEDTVYKMTKAMAANVTAMAAVVKPIDGPHAEGHGRRHRRAASTRARRKYLQGSRRDVAPAREGAAPRPFCAHRPMTAPTTGRLGRDTRPTTPRSRALAARSSRVIAVAMSLYHMYVGGVRAARGGHLPRHAPAVRADAGLPALSDCARRRAGVAHRSTCCCSPRGFGVRPAHLPQLRLLHQSHHLHRRPHGLGQGSSPWSRVVIVLEATRRVIGWALPLTAIAFLAYADVLHAA